MTLYMVQGRWSDDLTAARRDALMLLSLSEYAQHEQLTIWSYELHLPGYRAPLCAVLSNQHRLTCTGAVEVITRGDAS